MDGFMDRFRDGWMRPADGVHTHTPTHAHTHKHTHTKVTYKVITVAFMRMSRAKMYP